MIQKISDLKHESWPTFDEEEEASINPCENLPPGFYKHPNNCEKFSMCVKGTFYEYDCPQGTKWNDLIRVCDISENIQDC